MVHYAWSFFPEHVMRPITASPFTPSVCRPSSHAWANVLLLAVLALVLGAQTVRTVRIWLELRALDAQIAALAARSSAQNTPPNDPNANGTVQTPYGTMLSLPGLACTTSTDSDEQDQANLVDQGEGLGLVATVHDVRPPMACPAV